MRASHGPVAQAGGIVFRRREGQTEYLLIRPKRQPDQWIFPKGHIEHGESAVQAAIREVLEETGVEASPLSSVGFSTFAIGDRQIRVEYFVMSLVSTTGRGEGRKSTWAPFESALGLLSFADTRDLLKAAHTKASTWDAQ